MQTTDTRFQLVRACANSSVTGVVMAGSGFRLRCRRPSQFISRNTRVDSTIVQSASQRFTPFPHSARDSRAANALPDPEQTVAS